MAKASKLVNQNCKSVQLLCYAEKKQAILTSAQYETTYSSSLRSLSASLTIFAKWADLWLISKENKNKF